MKMLKLSYSKLQYNNVRVVVFIFAVISGASFFSPVVAQNINGSLSVCPGNNYTYTYTAPTNLCASHGTMYCQGCDQNSVVATNTSISLVWLPGLSVYSVSVPTLCQNTDDNGNPPYVEGVSSINVFALNLYTETFVCPNATSSLLSTTNSIPRSDSECAGTSIRPSLQLDPNYPLFATDGYPFDKTAPNTNGTGMATQTLNGLSTLTVYWAAGWQGTVKVSIFYDRRTWNLGGIFGGSCNVNSGEVASFVLTRSSDGPGGTLTGPVSSVVPNSTINLTYQPDPNYAAQPYEIKYFLNGTQIADQMACNSLNLSNFNVPNTPGSCVFTTQLLDQCGTWSEGPNITVNVKPTCSQDDPSNVTSSITGTDLTLEPEGYMINEGEQYTIVVAGITDFANSYSITCAGQPDVSISGNTFTVNTALGAYQIGFTKNTGSETCPDIPGISFFLGWSNVKPLTQDCPVVLPDDIGKLGFPNVSASDPEWNYFSATVTSRSITVKPGITLDLGAELILIEDAPVAPPADTDGGINYIQTTSYDEYNQVISQSRSYFDEQGRSIQTQAKNITAGVMLANASVYDAYTRNAISTLSAPVSAATVTNDGCGNTTTSDTYFSFSPGFIQGPDGIPYNASHFDISNGTVIENNPQPVLSSTPGTLGWYYSANNGTASGNDALMNEPLVAGTQYPYARTLWQRDGSGDVKGGTKPGDVFRAGSGHVATGNMQPVQTGDAYLTTYLSMRKDALGLPIPTSIDGDFFQSNFTDENGRTSTTYSDKGGNTIISLYFGNGSTPITTSYQFYDLKGKLVTSISPNGVSAYNGSNFDAIDKTQYSYNYRGLLTAMEETDAGRTEYIYRRDGKIRFSQNAEQRTNGRYSYTHYDRSGRPIESGEYQPVSVNFNSASMTAILENVSPSGGFPNNEGSFNNRLYTYYDSPDGNIPVQRTQRFVNGVVSRTQKDNSITTWYSYDEQGRVEWTVQNITGLGVKTLDYLYGQTGAVRQVAYQAGQPDQFTHYYEYDADGRLSKAYTSTQQLQYDITGTLTNPNVLTLQATYYYYLHGPIKRIEYANQVQGIDYTYTADGALKGINHFDPTQDPGNDGTANGFRPDVFGMTLDYYDNDYSSSMLNTGLSVANVPDQFGGHIKAARWHGPIQPDKQWGYAYTYDQRYQFASASWGQVVGGSLVIDPINPYQETLPSYDLNGNISQLQRTDATGTSIANFKYNYAPNKNQLTSVVQGSDPFRNYTYNNIGQMTQQQSPSYGIATNVAYDVTGKVVSVTDQDNNPVINNTYDDKGFRLSKTGYDKNGKATTEWSVRDISGNTIATYAPQSNGQLGVLDFPVYASGKIGVYKPQFNLTFYEVTDHLGTVRAVIGDKLTVDNLATMEDDWISEKKEENFTGITPVPVASFINHTPSQVTLDGVTTTIDNPSKAIRINNGQGTPNPVGGGIMLWVHPGDVINAEVFAKYANFDATNKTAITGLENYLVSAFINTPGVIDSKTIFKNVESPAGVFSAWGKVDNSQPEAFLTYILYDRDFLPQAFDFDQVSAAAEIPTVDPQTQPHERLHLDNVQIEKEGFIYIYVSNLSDQNMDVYFDDLLVTQQYSDIVAGGDYYPFGLEITDRQITREEYRYKYQGQYAEKDSATGWNHFQLREYDPVIGRAITTDPARQFHSPYLWVGNNPVSGIDPTGALSPYYDENGRFLGVDENGFKGEVRVINRDTWNLLSNGKPASTVEASISSKVGTRFSTNVVDYEFETNLEPIGHIIDHIMHNAPNKIDPDYRISVSNFLYRERNYNNGDAEQSDSRAMSQTNPLTGRITLWTGSLGRISEQTLNTVENIISNMVDHEYLGHLKMKLKDPDTYNFQRKQPIFKDTTPQFRETNEHLTE